MSSKFSYIYLLILLAFISVLGLIYYIRSKRKKEVEEIKILLPPHIEAIKALEKLREKDYLRKEKEKEYYIELDDILRVYLGRRFSKDTLDKTEFELIGILKELNLERNLFINLKNFLEFSSLVKYAKQRAGVKEGEEHWELLKGFVEKTKEEANASLS
ncbi:MAG: hypothetical protein WHV67_09110, partial [Thermoanaerobaculia bacterium]